MTDGTALPPRPLSTDAGVAKDERDHRLWPIVLTSLAAGTLAWYDFYVFGSLATTISPRFFPKSDPTLSLTAYISTFVIGIGMRPLGALFFGRIGDVRGRKPALTLSLLLMGVSTLLIGLLPTYRMVGVAAPIALIVLRVLQGFAFGGSYGGLLLFVAERAPAGRRGYYTSFVQIAPTLGLVLSIAAIVVVQYTISFKRFVMFGWRIPFLLSILLIGLSFYIRSRVPESQVFQRLKEKGTPASWLAAGSGGGNNLRLILAILGGALAGQGLLWYMAQLYVLFYLQNILKVDPFTATCTVAAAHLLGMPCFIFFGALSDKVGRRKIILSGCLLAAVLYVPVYAGMERASGTHVTRVVTAKNPVTGTRGPIPLTVIDGTLEPVPEATNPNLVALVLLVFVQVVVLAAVSGPLGAYCAETFRAETRYTSVGLTYHLGNGLLTGLLPLITLPLIATTGDVRAILYCVVALTLCIFMVGVFFLKESAMPGRQNQDAE